VLRTFPTRLSLMIASIPRSLTSLQVSCNNEV
jgi:hypothetical protein